MATKTVTLKDSNGDTLYPVTDSNVVNINQQKTLAQALDGVVYAEDPTQSATPTAWVTNSDIDWTTMPGSYSTTEQKTPFTWIDGKPIYKKTVNFGALPNASAKSVTHNIANLDHFVKVQGTAWTATKVTVNLPFASPNQLVGAISLLASDTGIDVGTGKDRREFANCYVTLWYTKTTD